MDIKLAVIRSPVLVIIIFFLYRTKFLLSPHLNVEAFHTAQKPSANLRKSARIGFRLAKIRVNSLTKRKKSAFISVPILKMYGREIFFVSFVVKLIDFANRTRKII